MRYAKGHGTGNDFIIVPDTEDRLELSPELVRRLCDRRTGIGADGVLRVVPAAPRAGEQGGAGDPAWFMDYRNADGSIAEMCGNGIRVFARYLIEERLAVGPEVAIATRAGTRVVREEPGERYTVDMGPAVAGGQGWAVVGGRRLTGLAVSVGNPHLVCLSDEPPAAFDLSVPPEVDKAMFPEGVNVEIARITGERSVQMRVRERGSGETQSCGTGAVAVAVAAARAAGAWPAAPMLANTDGQSAGADGWTVDVPGGRLAVVPSATASLLTGPAVIVADGEIRAAWLAESLATSARF